MGMLQGKVGLVTGGGSGLGRATCLLAAREGAAVAVLDIREEAAEATAEAVRAESGQAIAILGFNDACDEDILMHSHWHPYATFDDPVYVHGTPGFTW